MVFALCFDTNTLHCFMSERLAADYCRQHGGDWQLCDEQGRAVYPPGFAPRAQMGLLAAHLWLAEAPYAEGVLPYGFDPSPSGGLGQN
ncbi:hypothetical protein GCM10007907_25960 [Chitinimonas prasina]|uniref:Uncharacterized protein n=1 Tax=Chitinimonas prasina TaxID=1434937 RepID=A0ABQ5YFM6_9NEIS|nr:hypothetical protein [Chitinimonas prasina]GLR13806.1 hypothetical protein GCM10007907_25960 [Chitinimonas prasina]